MTRLLLWIRLSLRWRRIYQTTLGELNSYTTGELVHDLRLDRADFDAIACRQADLKIAEFVRQNPAYRAVWEGRGGWLASWRTAPE